MNNLYKLSFLFSFLLLLSACVDKKNTPTPPIKVETKEIKKIVVQKEHKTDLKQAELHKTCNNYRKYLDHSKTYIVNEFKNAYLNQKDITGANAQLFLIENNSPTPFAVNINKAKTTYNKYFSLARKSKCKLNKYKISPLTQIKQNIKDLSKKEEK